MSLINEALKKAQKQRTQEVSSSSPPGSPPVPESAPPRRVVKRSQPMPAQTLVIVGGACLVIVGVVAAGFWILIGPSNQTMQAPSPMVVGSAKPATPTVAPSAATGGTAAGVTPAPATNAATASAPSEASRASTASPSATQVPGTVPAATPTPVGGVASFVFDVKMVEKKPDGATPANDSAARHSNDPTAVVADGTGDGSALHIDVPASEAGFVPPNSRSSAIVDGLRISGIRASVTDPKVLMNERVYRLNDVIDHSIGLRLKEINANNLVFIDETGATYVRNF